MKKSILLVFDVLLTPLLIPSAYILKLTRKKGLHKLPITRKLLDKIGLLPVINHYYDPFFSKQHLRKPLNKERRLEGIDWNLKEQLAVLAEFSFTNEFSVFTTKYKNELEFYFNNPSFAAGDAEYWYNIIRLKQPKKIIEIGSGHSTKIARKAINKNSELNKDYSCEHICIEPYEMPWLEKLGIKIIREKVEDIDLIFFKSLQANDILFIDSSHMIRPQGDVLFEFLEILPMLNKGVIVHIHDIFSPRDYLKEWLLNEKLLWNEQYLLEAFLTNNKDWKIIGAVNFLKHNHYSQLLEKCPRLTLDREPGSFYIQKQ